MYLQVHFGMMFGGQIDMWSIGCILAEIYMGRPLIFGTTKMEILDSVSTIYVYIIMHIYIYVCNQGSLSLALSLYLALFLCFYFVWLHVFESLVQVD